MSSFNDTCLHVEQTSLEEMHVLQQRQADMFQVWGLGQGFAGLADML